MAARDAATRNHKREASPSKTSDPSGDNLYVNVNVWYSRGEMGKSVDALEAPETPVEPAPADLFRIQKVAADTGLTTRSIRYYEEIGLLEPAARSEGDYRLYDADDLARLRYIKGLRDDAGFSLAEIAQLLEDETARARNRARFRESHDPVERKAIVQDAVSRVDRQVATLRAKADRLEAMVAEANARRAHLTDHLGEIDAELAGDLETAAERHRAAHASADHRHPGRASGGRLTP
jgi:MerR family transcriptional regulator, repressor of the yfmOP operon